MGGNAIKTFKINRISNDVIIKLKAYFTALFEKEGITIYFPYDPPDKINHGDLDIVFFCSIDVVIDIIKLVINPKEIVYSGTVSFEFAFDQSDIYYQIDLIQTDHIGYFFLSYGDVGGIIGTIVKHFGLTFGINGLYIDIYSDHIENFIGKYRLVLSTDPRSICDYLGLDYSKWGYFKSNLEIYEWIVASRFFQKSIFTTATNRDHRKRLERPFYSEFIKYISENEFTKQNDDYIFINAIIEFDKCVEFDKLKEDTIKRTKYMQMYNGHILINDYKLDSKSISTFNKQFEEYIYDRYNVNFIDWILNTSQYSFIIIITYYIEHHIIL